MPKTERCPDTCPKCGADLRGEGYPTTHQRNPDGKTCRFRWFSSNDNLI